MDDGEYCGFDSLDKLTKWFDGELEDLKRFGFKIYVYDVAANKVRKGRRQCVFQKRTSDTVDIREIKVRVRISLLASWLENA